ncbi:MAG: hypothetical protein CVU84_15120 [Firmicutes bacterium HGW-Firmicutes-1]|jgi:hypothetical protein|nr:MAG: hypothetical protein CVU84_15120 [Firmicutes bacterium HGW-Firmicutes-1]
MEGVWVKRSFIISVFIFTILVGFSIMNNNGFFDKESGIKIEKLNEKQVEDLSKLCKVWGFVKYYHPKVIFSSVNWD